MIYTIVMTTKTILKQQIYQIIESLSMEHLSRLHHFLRTLLQPKPVTPTMKVAPIYQLHHHAVDTGITDLAENHDHYLYGADRQDD